MEVKEFRGKQETSIANFSQSSNSKCKFFLEKVAKNRIKKGFTAVFALQFCGNCVILIE